MLYHIKFRTTDAISKNVSELLRDYLV